VTVTVTTVTFTEVAVMTLAANRDGEDGQTQKTLPGLQHFLLSPKGVVLSSLVLVLESTSISTSTSTSLYHQQFQTFATT
jgi:hypothetical protein